MIELGAEHRTAIEALLSTRRSDAMFTLSNLRAQGFGGSHPHGMRLWGDAARPTALVGLTNSGMVLPFLPEGFRIETAAAVSRGRTLTGFAGPAAMVRPLLVALRLEDRPVSLDADEPQFLLDLEQLRVPEGGGTLAPLTEAPETAAAWRLAYNRELHLDGGTSADAAREVAHCIAEDSHRFLMVDGAPVAMTGFNASLPEIVQVGGVYTPPEARGRGLAGRAVALHLAEARARGARQATLFAATDAAVACYRKLGFARCGTFALVLFDGKVTP